MTDKKASTYRFSDDARFLIDALAKQLGISKTDVLEMAVRKLAKKEKVELPSKLDGVVAHN